MPYSATEVVDEVSEVVLVVVGGTVVVVVVVVVVEVVVVGFGFGTLPSKLGRLSV